MMIVQTLLALLLVVPVISYQQQNQVTVKLPSSLSISASSEGKLATLRHVDAQQTFEARGRDVSISTSSDVIVVTMTAGDFVWTSSSQPPYKNSFKTLELKFEAGGNWISFRKN